MHEIIDVDPEGLRYTLRSANFPKYKFKLPNVRNNSCRVSYVNTITIAEKLPLADWSEDALKTAKRTYDKAVLQYEAKSKLVDLTDDLPETWSKLSPLQQIGANWLSKSTSALLADEMGSGKTVQTCVALDLIGADLVLIVCPNAVTKSWFDHIKRWTSLDAIIVQGSTRERTHIIDTVMDGTAIIIGWSTLRLHTKLEAYGNMEMTAFEKSLKSLNRKFFDVIVADEAHRGKNPAAKQSRALWGLKGWRRWALTGTPIANSPADFWSILRFIAPYDWKSRTAFISHYCDPTINMYGGGLEATRFNNNKNRDNLHKLTDHITLRRGMSEIIGRTITKQRSKRYVELTSKHRKIYNSMRDDLIAKLENGEITVQNALVATIRLVQLSAAMLVISEDKTYVEMTLPSPKIDAMLDLLRDVGDIPLVILAPSRKLIDLASSQCKKKHYVITGKTPKDKRHANIAGFRRGDANILMATTGTVGEGVDLAVASHLVMMQRPWSMVESKQSEDRISRYTQEKNSVEIIDIITKDTIDERILSVLNTKQRYLSEFTREELIDVL